jgi:RNA polymerase sigma-70 factor, ECF subfamily
VLFHRRVDEKEFEAAALPHLHDVYRTALRVLCNARDAEDLAQETYFEAWKSFHRFKPRTNCRAWLFKILFHRIHHHRRKSFSSRIIREGDDILVETLAYEPPVPEQLADEEVLAALDKIPSDFREVVLLADVQEFSYKEIADTLGIPVGTVMSRLNRARKLLRAELAGLARSVGIKKAAEERRVP